MKPPTQVDGHRVGDLCVVDHDEWARTRSPRGQFRIARFETHSENAFAVLEAVDDDRRIHALLSELRTTGPARVAREVDGDGA